MKAPRVLLGTLIVCFAVQMSTVNAQGIPAVGGSFDAASAVHDTSALKSQAQAARTAHYAARSNELLSELIATQRATLAQLAALEKHMQMTEIDQHLIVQELRMQTALQARGQAPAQALAQARGDVPIHGN
jgi:hypothetical protein